MIKKNEDSLSNDFNVEPLPLLFFMNNKKIKKLLLVTILT